MDRIGKKSVFVAYTSYHVFVALLMSLSKKDQDEKQQLLIVANFSDAHVLHKSLISCMSSFFEKITLFDGEYNLDNQSFLQRGFFRYWGVRGICEKLVSYLKKEDFNHVYLFNEDRPYSLAILNYINQRKGAVRASFIEDGANTYNSHIEQKKTMYLVLGKIFYGLWWENIPIMGNSKFFDEIWALYPSFVRPDMSNKVIKQIPREGILELEKNQIAERILMNYGIKIKDLQGVNCLILLSHSSVIRKFPEYQSMLLRIIQQAQSSGYKVALKYHPRDDANSDFFKINNQPNVTILLSSAPLELIFILAKNNIRLAVSDLSTTGLSARLILSQAKVVSVGILLGSQDERFLKMLDAQGIMLPKSIEEFNQCILTK